MRNKLAKRGEKRGFLAVVRLEKQHAEFPKGITCGLIHLKRISGGSAVIYFSPE